MREAEARYGAPMVEAYGMTEATHQIASNPLPPAARHEGSVGIAAGAEFRIVDAGGSDVDRGAIGEVAIRGAGLTPGYLNNDQANAESFFDGWFRTGDQGRVDDGYLRLLGRLKEMIIRGGENISPYEIEAVLLSHPQVAEAVAFGVDDDKYGQTVAAAVVLEGDAGADELRRYCRALAGGVQGAGSHPRAGRDPKDAHRQGAAPADGGLPGGAGVRFAVLGAGAIGAYLGAALAQAGSDVTLIARGPHLQAMIEHGVRVQSPRGDFTSHPAATADLDALAEADVIVIGLKAHSLPELAPAIGQRLRPGAVVVPAQNGLPWWYFQGQDGPLAGRTLESVDPGGVISRSIPTERIVGCVVYCSTEIVEPGVIRHIEGTRFTIGTPDGVATERCGEISQALVAAGLKCPFDEQLRRSDLAEAGRQRRLQPDHDHHPLDHG